MSFPLDPLSEANLLAVVRKTTPESFVRLRQTSKGLNEFAETFSRRIQIHTPWEINLAPCSTEPKRTGPAFASVVSQISSGTYIEFPTEDVVQLCLRPRKKENFAKDPKIPLKEIPKAFSGFLLTRIGYCYDNSLVRGNSKADSHMAPEVREKYWEAIGQLNIRCKVLRFYMLTTPWSLINRLQPLIVILPWEGFHPRTVRVPEATKTIIYNIVDPIDMSIVPRHIENVITATICPVLGSLDEPIPMARFTLNAWHAGGTTFSRLQAMHWAISADEIPGSEAAGQYLKKCLEQTSYQGSDEIRSSFWNQSDLVICAAEMLVKNPAGKTALICIRYDVKKELHPKRLKRAFRVTLYFLTDPQEFSGSAEAYYTLDCRPRVNELIEEVIAMYP